MALSYVVSPEPAWSESKETLVEEEYVSDGFQAIANGTERRPLSHGVTLRFEVEKRSASTKFVSPSGQTMYTLYTGGDGVEPASKQGITSTLVDRNGTMVGAHMIPSKGKEMVAIKNSEPVKKGTWLSGTSMFSNCCGKFRYEGVLYKWMCIYIRGRVIIELHDVSSKHKPAIARYSCRSRSAHAPRRPKLELNPDFERLWDITVFSFVVLRSLKGGEDVPLLRNQEDDTDQIIYRVFF